MSNFHFILTLLVLPMIYSEEVYSPLTLVNPVDVVHNFALSHSVPDQKALSVLKDLGLKVLTTYIGSSTVIQKACNDSLHTFVDDFRKGKLYTYEVLDSWAKLESGILQGNVKWMGRYYECLRINARKFTGKFCGFEIALPSNIDPFDVAGFNGISGGACVPDTCSDADLSSILEMVLKNLTIPVKMPVYIGCQEKDEEWKGKDITGLVVCCVFGCLVMASTLYDYITKVRPATNKSEFSDESVLLSQSSSAAPVKRGKLHRILTSFSIIQNTKRLLSTRQKPTDITCLHGMRFLSMTWVMLAHSFIFSINYTDNGTFVGRYYVEHWEFQAIGNAYFSVDSFFFLSGLLVTYLGLRQLEKIGGKLNVGLMYLYRYIRLTPPYAFVLLMMMSLWPRFGDGAQWLTTTQGLEKPCNKYWWTNLLYINNLYPKDSKNECFAWGWYLANDTQFYLLAPMFLYVLYKSPKWGLALLSFFLVASMTITGAFSSHTRQQPLAIQTGLLANFIASITSGGSNGSSLAQPALNADSPTYSPYIADLYQKPWCRIGAYLVGLLTGYYLHTYGKKIKMPQWVAWLGWMVAAVTCCALVYCLYPAISQNQSLDLNTAAFYNAVSRPVWCMGLAWVTIACVGGYGGPVNTFLSWKVFMPLSRLTYCAYLIHPLVIWWFLATSEVLVHISMPFVIMMFLATLVLTNLLAYAVAMLVEFPTSEIMKILQNKEDPLIEPNVSPE